MQLKHCPICHHPIRLEALVADQTGRELLALVSRLDSAVAGALLAYLSLFCSTTHELNHARTLRLAQAVLALGEGEYLTAALSHTVAYLRGRGTIQNHNYLHQVLGSVQDSSYPTVNMAALSKTARKIERYQTLRR